VVLPGECPRLGHYPIVDPCERVWRVSSMQYDLGYFDDETVRVEPIENPFGPNVLPMSPE